MSQVIKEINNEGIMPKGGKQQRSRKNEVSIIMDSNSQNEAFARIAAAGFVAALDPTMEVLTEIKTAVSEAVTNAIIHGYDCRPDGKVHLRCKSEVKEGFTELLFEIRDEGKGIEDIEEAMTPLFTSKPEMERSGMGFTVMTAFMDKVEVKSTPGVGTTVCMIKNIHL